MSSFPIRRLGTLYHLSIPRELQDAGARMPACCMPLVESVGESSSPLSRIWRISREGCRFLEIDALSASHNAEIMKWGVRAGFARHAKAWEVKAYDSEARRWRTVRCTNPGKAAIVLTEPFMSKRSVTESSWFVATAALEAWYRDKVLPDAALGVLSLKYAADELDCDGALRRREDGSRDIVLFTQHLPRWAVTQLEAGGRTPYAARSTPTMGTRVNAYC